MKVSVCMITYNHEAYIAQAIESVMMQETNFGYELVIGEDYSTDRTREICMEYGKKYPNKIRLILNERNLGPKANFIRTWSMCNCQYIAILEGDDYWVAFGKLQKQVDFLDSHPEYLICFTRTICFDEDTKKGVYFLPPEKYQKEALTIEELLQCNFIPNCSVMYRKGLFKEFPNWYSSIEIGDWPIHLMNAEHGKIGYLDEVMATYRIHSRSYSASKTLIDKLLMTIEVYELINPYLDFKYTSLINELKAGIYQTLAQLHYDKGELAGARHYTLKSLRSLPMRKYPLRQDLLRGSVRIFLKSLIIRTVGRRFFRCSREKPIANG